MKAKKLPSGAWRVQVYLGTDENGKQIRRSVTGTDRRAVEAEAATLRNEHREGMRGGSFGAAADAFLETRGPSLSPSTRQSYAGIVGCLKRDYPRFCALDIHAISSKDMQAVIDGLTSAGRSPKTVSNYRGLITSVLTFYGVRPPLVRMPQKHRADLHIPDEVTVRRTLKAAAGTELELPIMLAAFGPLRRGEICALHPEDVNGSVVHVRRSLVKDGQIWREKPPKTTTSDRYIEMPAFVAKRLNDAVPDENGHLIHMNPNALQKRFVKLLRRADIAPYRFHDLRHFCASDLHAKGVPDIYIMQRTGHSSPAVLHQVYTHTLQDQSEEQTRLILAHFESMVQ